MSEASQILVDTNILFDVIQQDPKWADWSQEKMGQFRDRMVINPLIYTELCYEAEDRAEVDAILIALGLHFLELPRQTLFLSSQAFKRYRQLGGTKTAPLPDFFIGAHAEALNIPILTRDVKRYRTYFPDVELITPE